MQKCNIFGVRSTQNNTKYWFNDLSQVRLKIVKDE